MNALRYFISEGNVFEVAKRPLAFMRMYKCTEFGSEKRNATVNQILACESQLKNQIINPRK